MRDVLESIGLATGEAVIYLALLRHGTSKVYDLAEQTGRHRTNIYDTLEKLEEKGLVSHVTKENVKHYTAAPPERLTEYLKEKEERVESIMPALREEHDRGSGDTDVHVFQGKEGLKTMLNDILRCGKDYVVFEEAGKIHDVLPYYYPTFNEELEEQGIHVRVITQDASAIATRSGMEMRSLEFFAYPAATAVYDDRVAIFVWDKPHHAIQIRSEDVANSWRAFFETLWDVAEAV